MYKYILIGVSYSFLIYLFYVFVKNKNEFIKLFTFLILAIGFSEFSKVIIGVHRPSLSNCMGIYSYPSTHSVISAFLFFSLNINVIYKLPLFFIPISRVLLECHRIPEIIAGFVLGFVFYTIYRNTKKLTLFYQKYKKEIYRKLVHFLVPMSSYVFFTLNLRIIPIVLLLFSIILSILHSFIKIPFFSKFIIQLQRKNEKFLLNPIFMFISVLIALIFNSKELMLFNLLIFGFGDFFSNLYGRYLSFIGYRYILVKKNFLSTLVTAILVLTLLIDINFNIYYSILFTIYYLFVEFISDIFKVDDNLLYFLFNVIFITFKVF